MPIKQARQQIVSAVAAQAPVHVAPLSPALGAKVTGINLNRLDDPSWRTLQQAFTDYHLVAIPAQQMDPEQLLTFSRRLGPLEPHILSEFHHIQHPEILMLSNVVEEGKPKGLADAGTYWHSDLSYKAKPSFATLLHAVEIPDEGGNTHFCNMVKAYEDLPEATKQRIATLKAEHNYAYRSNKLAEELGNRPKLTPERLAATPSVFHHIVRTHPVTGRKAIYVNPGFTVRVMDVTPEESAALLKELFDHCLQERYRVEYRWTVGDVVIWDNAALMHAATTRDLPREKRRTLLRTIISGDEPY